MARRLLSLLLAFFVALPMLLLSAAAPQAGASANDGLSYRSSTTYTVDAISGVVHVLAEVSLTNTIPDKRDGANINRRYFTGFSLPVPVGAINQVATNTSGDRKSVV